MQGILQYTNYTYITNTCACVESPHYLASFVVCFQIVIKTLLHSFDSFTCITFYLCCNSATFLGACTHCNAMKPSIESICLLQGHRRDIYEQSSAITVFQFCKTEQNERKRPYQVCIAMNVPKNCFATASANTVRVEIV